MKLTKVRVKWKFDGFEAVECFWVRHDPQVSHDLQDEAQKSVWARLPRAEILGVRIVESFVELLEVAGG